LIAELAISRVLPSTPVDGYLGLVPSEHSSGSSVKRGGITKAGTPPPPAVDRGGMELPLPGPAQPRVAVAAGGPAQADPRHPLEGASAVCARYRRLARTGKPANIVTTAIARDCRASCGPSPCRWR